MVAGMFFVIFIRISDTNLDTEPCPALSNPCTDRSQCSAMSGIISPLWMALLGKQADSGWPTGFAWCKTIWRIADYEIAWQKNIINLVVCNSAQVEEVDLKEYSKMLEAEEAATELDKSDDEFFMEDWWVIN